MLWNPTISTARDRLESMSLESDRPDVLHICAVVDTSSRQLKLGFSEGPGESESAEAFQAIGISQLAQAVGPAMPPLVVFDALAPPHRERADQAAPPAQHAMPAASGPP